MPSAQSNTSKKRIIAPQWALYRPGQMFITNAIGHGG